MAFQIDQSHSQIQFTVRHMMLSKVRGVFEKWSGTVNLDLANPARTTVEIVVDTASLNTKDEKRDAHLRSPDFLDVEKFPQMVSRAPTSR